MKSTVTHHCTITLATGESYTTVATTPEGKLPKAWKSLAMRAAPYGACVRDATFSRTTS